MSLSLPDVAAALGTALPLPAAPAKGEIMLAEALDQLPLPEEPGAAVRAKVGARPGSPVSGEICVVVGSDLAEALRTSPMGELSVAAAVQPAIDAAAAAAGVEAETAEEIDLDAVVGTYGGSGSASVVGLVDVIGETVATAILDLTASGQSASGPAGGLSYEATLAAAEAAAAISGAAGPAVAVLPQLGATGPAQAGGAAAAPLAGGLDLLRDVEMEVTVELGRTRMPVRELLSLAPGTVVELDRAAGSPADLLVNGQLIARGEVVVVDEDFGIRITEILAPGADRTTFGHSAGGSAA